MRLFNLSRRKKPGGIEGFSASVRVAISSGVIIVGSSLSSDSEILNYSITLSSVLNILSIADRFSKIPKVSKMN